jgi:hypothetical protein
MFYLVSRTKSFTCEFFTLSSSMWKRSGSICTSPVLYWPFRHLHSSLQHSQHMRSLNQSLLDIGIKSQICKYIINTWTCLHVYIIMKNLLPYIPYRKYIASTSSSLSVSNPIPYLLPISRFSDSPRFLFLFIFIYFRLSSQWRTILCLKEALYILRHRKYWILLNRWLQRPFSC